LLTITTKGRLNMKLKEIFKIENILSGRKTPIDIERFLNDEYFSNGSSSYLKYGDLEITHFLRAYLKEYRELDLNNELLMKVKEIKTIINNNSKNHN
jgi:hypothetical protein